MKKPLSILHGQSKRLAQLSVSLCLVSALLACNGNDDNEDKTKSLLANSPLAGEPEIAAGAKTSVPHYAKLGPLQGALVAVYDPVDKETSLATGTTGSDGAFNLTFTKALPELRPLIVEIHGGMDTDPDDNASTGNTPIENKGVLHAIVFASDLLDSKSIIVSPVTEIVYQRLQGMIGVLSPAELRQKLNDVSSQLLAADITGNSITDYKDILAFDPSKSEMHNKLLIPFDKYHQKLSAGKSFIEALRDNDQNAVALGSELLGASAPSIELPETNVSDNVKLDVYLSGYGTLESGLFKKGKWRNSDGTYSLSVPRSLKEEYALIVTPDTGRKVVSWVGCNSISTDRLTCLVKPDQSKSVYAVLGAEPVFKPEVKAYKDIPMTSDVVISDSAGVMTISTHDPKITASLAKLEAGMVMGLPYLPHPLVGVTNIVAFTSDANGAEVRFKFIDKQVTDVLDKATFYSTPEFKPQVGLEDVISVTMINDSTILKNPKVNLTDSNFANSPLQGNNQTPIVPKYQDRSGGNHVGTKAWELVIHKDRCVLYGDEVAPTSRPVIPADAKNDTLWTSALRASEGDCDNKTLIYKPYKDYALDFKLTGVALNETTNAHHARFANMTFMQHMDKKDLANTPLYLISGTKKRGETMRTAAAWTWAKGMGPVLKVRKNVFLARKSDGRAGFDFVSFDSTHRPHGDLYNVADFKCANGKKCSLADARLPNANDDAYTENPWYFGPNDPLPSPYKRAVDTNNLMPLLGSDGLSVDFPFKRFPWLSVGVNARLGVGMSVDYLFDFSISDFRAAFKLIPELALEPRLEVNLKASTNSSDWKKAGTEKPKLELTLMRINVGYSVLGPVATVLKPELTLSAGVEFGGEAKIYAAYTRGMKAKLGVDAFYDKDFHWDWWDGPYTTTTSRLDFPRSFETYKSVFEFGAEGQLYAEPYLEFRMEGSVTGVGNNLANVALRGFLNANAGFEAGVAINSVDKPSDAINADIDRIGNEYKVKVVQEILYKNTVSSQGCDGKDWWSKLNCYTQAVSYAQSFSSFDNANNELKKSNTSFDHAPEDITTSNKQKIHSLYDKNYGGKFVDKVLDGSYTKSSKVSCKLGLKFGLDAGIRATASINTKNINIVGDWIGSELTVTLFEQRWPVKLQFIDDWNEKLAVCSEADKPEPDDTAEEGTASIHWKTNPTNNGQYALIECGTFSECKIQAAQADAQLTSITSSAENQWIADNFVPSNSNKGAWIGLNDVEQEGSYQWESGEGFSYSNWNNGEPNNSNNEDVVSMIAGGKWNDNALTDTGVTRAVIEKRADGINWKTNPDNGNGYALVDCGTWQQCDTKARSVGARLVSIGSANENQWIVNTFITSSNKGAWIGLNDIDQEGIYKWVSGEVFSYSNWNSGEPNNAGNEDVVAMTINGKWNDDSVNNTTVGRAIFERLQPNWKFNSATNHSYAVLDCGSWPACQAQAQTLGANLVTVNDSAEQQWLASNFNSTSKYWIGYTDKDQEGVWKWISGESPSYTNWNSGEPNNVNDEDFAEVVENGRWNDAQLGNMTVTKGVIEKN